RAAGESSELRAEVEQLAVSAAEASRTASEAEARALVRRAEHEEARADGLRLLGELNQAENRARSLSEARDLSRSPAERAPSRLASATETGAALAREAASVEAEASATEDARTRSDEDRRELETRLAALAEELRRLDAERGAGDVEHAKLSSRIEFLLDRERDLE